MSLRPLEQFKTADDSNLPPIPTQREQTVPDEEPVSLEERKLLIKERLDNLQHMFEEEARQ